MLIINFRYIDAAHRIKLYKSQTFLISNEIQLNQYTVLYPIYYIILQNTHGTYEIRTISRENKSFLICLKIIFIFIFIFISLSLSKKESLLLITFRRHLRLRMLTFVMFFHLLQVLHLRLAYLARDR